MEPNRVIVIGAGPSGLAAALSALKEGAHVTVLEHMEEPGKKLLLTGNGQCNLSNTEVGPNHYHGDKTLITTVLRLFDHEALNELMSCIGIETVIDYYRHETCGYFYPSDHSAKSVRDGFVRSILDYGGKMIYGVHVLDVWKENGVFKLKTDRGDFEADRLIFATGSNACPKTGSDSSIYPILKKLEIRQKTWLPALVALKSDAGELKILKGLRADASVILRDETADEVFQTAEGEVQFREHYISGLPVLQLSRYAAIALKEGHKVKLICSLKQANNKDKTLPFGSCELNITGTEGFEKATTCSGGVTAEEINPLTMEAVKIPGLFFAGEMMDVDGDCGGFNLHFAFASGTLAGRNAAK